MEPARPASDQELELAVGDVAQGGWCVAREPGGRVVLVRHTLPGERVLARLTESTAKLARAEAVEILEASPDRVEPPCPHAHPGGCGGCDWQHASLTAQRRFKAAVIAQQLRRIAGLDREVTVEPLPGDDGRPGLADPGPLRGARRRPGRPAPAPLPRDPRRRDLPDRAPPGQRVRDHPGPLAGSGVGGRGDLAGHQRAAVVVTPARKPHRRKPAGRAAGRTGGQGPGGRDPGGRAAVPGTWAAQVEGPVLVAGDGVGLTALRGGPFLHRTAAGRRWRTSAGVFWQVHPAAADVLAALVREVLRPQPGDAALDLYCGAGLFAGVLAGEVGPSGTVIGIESDPAAVRDARHNLRDTPWARIHKGDVAEVLGHARMAARQPRGARPAPGGPGPPSAGRAAAPG